MGLFDWVMDVPKKKCKKCGKPLDGWQTKDLISALDEVSYKDCYQFYTICCKQEYLYSRKRARSLKDFKLYIHNYEDS